MIHHVSISARNPKHVAEVLAEVMGGRCYPFPGSVPDSFKAVSGDAHGTMIEVYPEDVALQPGQDGMQVEAVRERAYPESVPFHFLLSVSASQETIERIGRREGWRTELFGRGKPGEPPMFHVIEFWIENRLMVELAPKDSIKAYTDLFQLPKLDGFFGMQQAA